MNNNDIRFAVLASALSMVAGLATAGEPPAVTVAVEAPSKSADSSGCAGFPIVVSRESELNDGIACYNSLQTPGLHTIELANDIALSAPTVAIDNDTSDLAIEGRGFTVDAQGNGRAFEILTGASVFFREMTITGGLLASGDGAGLSIEGGAEVVLEKVIVEGNLAEAGNGGGVANAGALTALGSTFSDNRALGFESLGGGLVSDGFLTLVETDFSGNQAEFGGAVYVRGTTANIQGGDFLGNSATELGGGIRALDTVLTLVDATLGLSSARRGGGLAVQFGSATIQDSWFAQSSAVETGAAIYFVVTTATVQNGLITSSDTRDGAVFVGNAQVTMKETAFVNNLAWSGGAALVQGELASLTLESCLLTGNQAVEGGGGAIFVPAGHLQLRSSTLLGNQAKVGGGALWVQQEGSVEIVNSTFSGNDAEEGEGGAIFCGDCVAELRNATLFENSAATAGGAIFATGVSSVSLEDSLFSENSAPQHGGCFVDTQSAIESVGYNLDDRELDDEGSCLPSPAPGDRPGGFADLQPLADNGGPAITLTHALGFNSEALDAGGCSSGTVTQDQRGVPRPQARRCDIGAFEADYLLFLDGFETGDVEMWSSSTGLP